jgi:hypothetical protein
VGCCVAGADNLLRAIEEVQEVAAGVRPTPVMFSSHSNELIYLFSR